MKRFAFLIFLTFTVLISNLSVFAEGVSSEINGFTDVPPDAWYSADVTSLAKAGLIDCSEGRFYPDKQLTCAEAVKLAVSINQLHYNGTVLIEQGEPWYKPYCEYLSDIGVDLSALNMEAEATRAECIYIFASALKDSDLEAINQIPDGAISDVAADLPYVEAIYKFCRAGIICGSDENRSCHPNEYIKRSEAAAIAVRMLDKERRIRFDMKEPVKHTLEVIDGVTYIDGVLIVNKSYPLPPEYAPGGLTKECSEAFAKLQAAASADGLNIYSVSGYRSYEYQKGLYQRYAARDGAAAADRYSARPGHSEHQTGLAIDCNSVYQSFADTAAGRWLAAHCHEYGFIIRYPKGAESITGYMFEPWHIRYLGVEMASKIHESGLTLEEYFGITSEYTE
ncbi:MAG: hypothetical protein GX827_06230 [Clostridiales bacterium]|jgi:hypothetical protein|nr:hypothetical protein [Clostridiales bacterium]